MLIKIRYIHHEADTFHVAVDTSFVINFAPYTNYPFVISLDLLAASGPGTDPAGVNVDPRRGHDGLQLRVHAGPRKLLFITAAR